MADKTTGGLDAVEEAAIGSLPGIADLYDETLIPVEQQGEARHMTGAQWKRYAQAGVSKYVEDAQKAASDAQKAVAAVGTSVEDAAASAEAAKTAREGAEIFNDYRERTFGTDEGYTTVIPTAGNVASGGMSHAEGTETTASGPNSHAEGAGTTASGSASHAEGGRFTGNKGSTAAAYSAHAEGTSTTSSGKAAHAEGASTIASGDRAHAEGSRSVSLGYAAHAEGSQCESVGAYSHAGGSGSRATGFCSFTHGEWTRATSYYQTVFGRHNVTNGSTSSLIVGNGFTPEEPKNIFRVENIGVYASGSYNSSGADYAELFEWQDGNPENEDRAGRFVTLDGDKIRIAAPGDDFILGIVSGAPSIVGDVHDDQWQGMFLTDVFGRPIVEDVDIQEETREVEDPEDPEKTTVEIIRSAGRERRQKLNPAYDNTQKYIPRTERPEWDAVGMLGKLVTVDDGTCEVNGWATVGKGGIAVKSAERTKYRVLGRIDGTHVRILIL